MSYKEDCMNKHNHSFLEVAETMPPGSPVNVPREDIEDMTITGFIPCAVTKLRREGIRVKYSPEKKQWIVLGGFKRGQVINSNGEWIKGVIENLDNEVEVIEGIDTNSLILRYKGHIEKVRKSFVAYCERAFEKNYVTIFKEEIDRKINRIKENIECYQEDIKEYEKKYRERHWYYSEEEKEHLKSHIEDLKRRLQELEEEYEQTLPYKEAEEKRYQRMFKKRYKGVMFDEESM